MLVNNEPPFALYGDYNYFMCGNSSHTNLDSNVVSLIVTSPPYNVNIQYDVYNDNKPYEEYFQEMDAVWKECWRIMRTGGRLCINVTDTGYPVIPLYSMTVDRVMKLGFTLLTTIIWNKVTSMDKTTWGSWKSCSAPCVKYMHEYIIIFAKESTRLRQAITSKESDITRDEFMVYTRSIWDMHPETRRSHPAPFPEELPYRCIKLLSYPGDLVYDPFCGSGTTCLVANRTGRKWVGYDVSGEYIRKATARLENEKH